MKDPEKTAITYVNKFITNGFTKSQAIFASIEMINEILETLLNEHVYKLDVEFQEFYEFYEKVLDKLKNY
jgi:hypothetical protein